MEHLKHKIAIVTGASSGIGRAIALELAKEGVHLIITGRNRERLNQVRHEIETKFDVNVHSIIADVTNKNDVINTVNVTIEKYGKIDILINNAGLVQYQLFADSDEDDLRNMLETNIIGPFNMMKAVYPHMKEVQSGDIINIASMSGINATKGSGLYSASKFGLIGLTEGIMQEIRRDNIRVAHIEPSAVLTENGKRSIEESIEKGETVLDPNTMTHAEDLAEFIVSQLKLNRRTFIKSSQIWATNPQNYN